MTMAFVVMAFGTLFSGLAIRRDPASGLTPPILEALQIMSIPALLTVLAVELTFMQGFLSTRSLTGGQWVASIALAAVMLAVIEGEKAVRRRRMRVPESSPVERAVAPARAISSARNGR